MGASELLRHSAIDRSSPLPFYHQLKEWFYENLSNGSLASDDQVPSEAELCAAFQVSRTVVRQALDDLVNEGRLYRRKGKGTFVSRTKIGESVLQRLTSFYQDMIDRGFVLKTDVLEQHIVQASSVVAENLGLRPGQEVIRLIRLRYIDGEPIMLTTDYIPHHLCPGLLGEDLTAGSLFELLANKYGIHVARGRRTFEAEAASAQDANFLGIAPGTPVAFLRGVFYTPDGRALEYSEAKHRGDRSRFEVELVSPEYVGQQGGGLLRCSDLPGSNDVKNVPVTEVS